MGEHIQVHRRGNKDGSLHREVGRQEHIVCHSVCHLADGRGGGWCDDHSVCPQTDVHVAIPRAIASAEELTNDGA